MIKKVENEVGDPHESSVPTLSSDGENESSTAIEESRSSTEAYSGWKSMLKFVGPSWLMALAYLDPGNLESDIQNGALGGYSILWVLMWCTVAGLVLQCLAAKLGVVTGKHLAEHCRDQYSPIVRYSLWVMTEIAIVGSDAQEVLGSAIAWNLLTGIPLVWGVILTGVDTFLFLALHSVGIRAIESFIFVLILTMLICFWINMGSIEPSGEAIILGTLNFTSLPYYAVPLAVATLGAVIMPHNIYLHSAMVLPHCEDIDRTNKENEAKLSRAYLFNKVESSVALFVSFLINLSIVSTFAGGFFDVRCAADGDAFLPPRMCANGTGHDDVCCGDIGLSSVGTVLEATLGGAAKYLWGVGLLAAGQASTLTGTLAGQFVMEGFLNLKISIWKRLILTRSVALIPSIIVGVIATNSGPALIDQINQWLNILQAVQLPFALLPVMAFTSRIDLMGEKHANGIFPQIVCWLLTLLLLSVNFVAIFQQFEPYQPEHHWVIPVVVVVFVFYAAFVLYIAYPALVATFTRVQKSIKSSRWCGRRSN